MVQPLVSVIMPAYNAERYIADSIRSVLDQTYQSWELVMVDDGSTDGTAEIVRRLAAGDSRIKYVFQENGRLGKARNRGVANSKGTLIAFLDSDDLWLKDKLDLQVQTLEATNADVIYSDGFIFQGDDPAIATKTFPIVRGRVEGVEMLNLLLVRNSVPVLSVLMRRETFDEAGPFEESPPYHGCEDYDLWLKAARRGAVFYGMGENLVRYRRHPAAMTSKDSNVLKPMLRVVSRHIEDGSLGAGEKKTRLRGLYRELIDALLKEGEFAEAGKYMKELSVWDKSGVVTLIQKVLMRVSPGSFSLISRECLYRIEWHLRSLAEKVRAGAADNSRSGNR